MDLSNLQPAPGSVKSKTRIGRGAGSGKDGRLGSFGEGMGFDCECYSDSAAGKNLCQLAAAEVACAAKF